MKRITTTLLAILLTLMLAGVAACGNGSSSSSSSSSSMPSSSSNSSMPQSSSSEYSSVPDTSDDDSSLDDDSTSDSGSGSVAPTLSTDLEGIGALSAESKDWGPGTNVDAQNRPYGALQYNEKYGKYDALFISEESENIYMTFDEGYEYGLTDDILDVLKEKNVKAIFFVTRHFAESEPALVRRMIDEGHTVGNHSWAHKNYSTLTLQEAYDDLTSMHKYILDEFGYEMKYFRFPSGNFTEQTLAMVQQAGYKSVFWSFAYRDWLVDDQPDPAAALSKVRGAACPGMIYLLHAVSQTNASILADVIDGVESAGFVWADPSAL